MSYVSCVWIDALAADLADVTADAFTCCCACHVMCHRCLADGSAEDPEHAS